MNRRLLSWDICFEHEEDGTSGTDIEFVDIDENEVRATVEIVSECNGREKPIFSLLWKECQLSDFPKRTVHL